MAEYYVIRDKNTGLYFRGKGANRWGKHYNQATIYRVKGTAEHSVKEIAWRGEQAEIVQIQIIENPTDIAEVVRCKDCKHLEYGYQCYYPLGMMLNNDGDAYVLVNPDEDFCSHGERKDNG
jgi:hypothetical protein